MLSAHCLLLRSKLVLILSFILMVSAVCRPASASDYAGEYPYKIVATTGMVADIVQVVAGKHGEVTRIIGSGVDPHLYMPSRRDMILFSNADIIFYNGLQLEGKMSDVLVKIGRKTPVYAVTELLDKKNLLEDGDYHDPHVWMDVMKWKSAVQSVGGALSEYDSKHAEEYKENAQEYMAQLDRLDAYIRKVVSTIPEERRFMVTAHDAFGYFGNAYDLEVKGIQGLSTESEAGIQDINRLVSEIVARKVPAVFVESSVSDKNVKALIEGAQSRGHQVSIGGTLFSDAMGPDDTYEGTYIGMLDHNATLITRALGGQAPSSGSQGKLKLIDKELKDAGGN